MDKYQKVIKPKETLVTDEKEIRCTAVGSVSAYVSRAAKVLNEMNEDHIIITGTGNAITKAVQLAEVVKRRIKGLHQITSLSNTEIVDEYEPLEEGLDKVIDTRSMATIEIKLSKKELDTSDKGYQPPLPESEVKEMDEEDLTKNRGRGRGRGKGKGKGKGKGRGKGRGKSDKGKGKGKGKSKDEDKGKGKSDKGKGKGKGKDSKGKGKDSKGKGKDKGKGKGKSKGASKGKGWGGGYDSGYGSSWGGSYGGGYESSWGSSGRSDYYPPMRGKGKGKSSGGWDSYGSSGRDSYGKGKGKSSGGWDNYGSSGRDTYGSRSWY